MLRVDISNTHVHIILLHVDTIELACKGQTYVNVTKRYIGSNKIYKLLPIRMLSLYSLN